MKRTIFTFLIALCACSVTFAQRFNVGLRAGTNIADYAIPTVATDDGQLRSGGNKAGFETALMLRIALTKHINVQAEFEYDRANYAFKFRQTGSAAAKELNIHANRIEIPVVLGLNVGPFRFFGGAAFRIAHNEKSSSPSMLQVKFSDSKVALTGGAALNIRRFFIEGRLTGYPKGAEHIYKIKGTDHNVSPRRDLKWSITAGILF